MSDHLPMPLTAESARSTGEGSSQRVLAVGIGKGRRGGLTDLPQCPPDLNRDRNDQEGNGPNERGFKDRGITRSRRANRADHRKVDGLDEVIKVIRYRVTAGSLSVYLEVSF